ncbi:hypothetical protein H7J06_30055 [Mycobacterium hodleri]|uniref:hypothetical protein n=1 Tax=Mycolicibacterium hodleri TaxID=49897 RepID=UPI0021F27781|nr:hypothetical protein [Mycolicibacterium hodleri]MCV7137213.1 hypothetical protein [Mycolicibacterium hodleri]
MSLLDRTGGASVVVTPGVVTPRQTVDVTVTTDDPLREVRSARLDWGYVNFYQFRSSGDDRDADDWVSVIVEDLPIAAGEFTGASSSFRVPSWAPASSPVIARWECRLSVDREGPDVEARGEFTVRIGTADVESYVEPLEHVSGAAETVVDVSLAKPVWRAGDIVTGHVTLTPIADLPDGDLAVSWQRERDSHPLTRTPGPGSQLDGRIIQLDNRIQLRAGTPVTVAFEMELPDDAPPTAAAVHSSINWYVHARLTYRDVDGQLPERVRRPITVVNAP